jgi:hypothetical protein
MIFGLLEKKILLFGRTPNHYLEAHPFYPKQSTRPQNDL